VCVCVEEDKRDRERQILQLLFENSGLTYFLSLIFFANQTNAVVHLQFTRNRQTIYFSFPATVTVNMISDSLQLL